MRLYWLPTERAKQGKPFFFEKKNQKTFVPGAVSTTRIVLATPKRLTQPRSKSFLVLFFKKGLLALTLSILVSATCPCHASGVVSLNLCTDQLLVLLAPERVAALEPLARDPALSFVAGRAAGLPVVRNDAEAVLRLKPDLVLAGNFSAQTTLALLRARGVRVVQVGDASNFADIERTVGVVAEALGVPARGQAMVAVMRARLAALRPAVAGRTALLWQARGWSAGPGSLGDAVLRAAGFVDVGTGGHVGLEALVAHTPQVLVTESAPSFPSQATDLAWHPALRGIARRSVNPALLVCGGPFTVGAAEALAR